MVINRPGGSLCFKQSSPSMWNHMYEYGNMQGGKFYSGFSSSTDATAQGYCSFLSFISREIKGMGWNSFFSSSWFPIHASFSPHRLFSSSFAHDMPFLIRSCALQDFLGQTFCTLGEIVGSPASRLEKPLGWVEMSDSFAPTYIPVQQREQKNGFLPNILWINLLSSVVLCIFSKHS